MIDESRPLVLHVIHHLCVGGLENGLVNLINHMPVAQFRHAVLCVEDYSDFRLRIMRPDVDVYALHRSRIGVWRMRVAMYQLFRRLRPTIVHTRNLSGLDALAPARLAGVPLRVHGEHGFDVDNLGGDNKRHAMLRRLHAPLVNGYVTVSKSLETYLRERVGVAGPRIRQVYNGVDTERFAPQPTRDFSALPLGFAGPDKVIVGTVGRLQPVKDQATLLRAFAALEDADPLFRERMRLVIVGDGPLSGQLRALAHRLGIANMVCFTGASGEVARLLPTFDIFVLPSLSEGISNTLLEAMASAVPVLASAVGGNLELVRDGHVGHLFPPGDTPRLAQFLAEYGADAALRQRLGAAARRHAIEQFGLAAMVGNYAALYADLCAGAARLGHNRRQ